MIANYGFSALNKNLTPNLNNGFIIDMANKAGSMFTAVRVINILLDETFPDFEFYGGWNSLGTIICEEVNNPKNVFIASPLNSNTKNYPLINEIVYTFTLPNTLIGEINVSTKSYYIDIVSLWNHPHHNAYPSKANEPPPPQQKDYVQTQAGSTSIITNEAKKIFLGKTFYEKPNIHPLLPFEGDFIQEGRWGNSIRLGSTVGSTPNNWSDSGINGDPITIIRNGQGDQTEEGWMPITEDINNDDSSIYLTSTQKIPLKAKSTSYVSYSGSGYEPPILPNNFEGKQIILDSGRLVFNSYSDHILFSSAKSINLNSQESVNIDTTKFIIQADNIYLGTEKLATEPLLLGNTTTKLLKDLMDALSQLSNTLKTAQTSPTIIGQPSTLPSINLAAVTLSSTLKSLDTQLNNITSKRNFTL
jgi:hypothetical protein